MIVLIGFVFVNTATSSGLQNKVDASDDKAFNTSMTKILDGISSKEDKQKFNKAIEIITGKGTKNYQKMSVLGSYIYDYLTKPLNLEELISSVEQCYNNFLAKIN